VAQVFVDVGQTVLVYDIGLKHCAPVLPHWLTDILDKPDLTLGYWRGVSVEEMTYWDSKPLLAVAL
jgi:hypothetical protein